MILNFVRLFESSSNQQQRENLQTKHNHIYLTNTIGFIVHGWTVKHMSITVFVTFICLHVYECGAPGHKNTL